MSTTQDKTVVSVSGNKVFIEQDGSLYLIKTTKTYKFLLINQDGKSIYGTSPSKIEKTHVTPESLGYTKKAEWLIYIYKVNHSDLQDTTEFYVMPLYFEVPDEKRYRCAYFFKTKSERVFLKWFDSASCSEVSINDPEFCKRGKATKLASDTILLKNAPIFTLSASGELERRLDSEAVW
jgi:hypothetical protein